MYSELPEHANGIGYCENYLKSSPPCMLSYIVSIKLLIVFAASDICDKGGVVMEAGRRCRLQAIVKCIDPANTKRNRLPCRQPAIHRYTKAPSLLNRFF